MQTYFAYMSGTSGASFHTSTELYGGNGGEGFGVKSCELWLALSVESRAV